MIISSQGVLLLLMLYPLLVNISVLCLLLLGATHLRLMPAMGHLLKRGFWALTTIPRDLSALMRYVRVRYKMREAKRKDATLTTLFHEVMEKNRAKTAFCSHAGDRRTFDEVEMLSNQIANCFSEDGFGSGDVVCVFMTNSVDYVSIWMGLSKIGVIPALVNSQLKDASLLHCIDVVSCKAVVCGADLQEVLNGISEKDKIIHLPKYVWGSSNEVPVMKGAIDLSLSASSYPQQALPTPEDYGYRSELLYIYTSGTTGLPKAAVITNSRAIFLMSGTYYMFGLHKDDIIYNPLPLSHTSGGLLGVGQTLLFGCTSVLRSQFSVSNYWSEVCKQKATVGMYIGEMCSYLMSAPETPQERQHQIRKMLGNGLRHCIWEEFKQRFRIKSICEFYGSTEGNVSLVNTTGKTGAVGFLSLIVPSYYPVVLLACDLTTGEVIRDEKVLCVHCRPGQTGQLAGLIRNTNPAREFAGYLNEEATNQAIVRGIYKHGDAAFLSGDLMYMDQQGYLYFRDRLGDTYRWKGENVSCLQVEAAIMKAVEGLEVVVYGVEVEGHEGRAGMVALVDPSGILDLETLLQHLYAVLPPFAVPRFIRITSKLTVTETLKVKKTELQQDGFNPFIVNDDLYFLDQIERKYVALTPTLYSGIVEGMMRI